MSHSVVPEVISSATIFPVPPPCVTQTASASQKPPTSRDSPIPGLPSGVQESSPLILYGSSTPLSSGRSSSAAAYGTAQSSSWNGSTDTPFSEKAFVGTSSGSRIRGSCQYDPRP